MQNIHIGKWKGDRNRKSKQKMRTHMGTQQYRAQREAGYMGIMRFLDRLISRFPDYDKRAKERRAQAVK